MEIRKRPNIFEYATKEFSLDAMVRWFLECISCKEPYKSVGEAFVRDFIFMESKCDINKPISLLMCENQFKKIDVFSLISCDNKVYPIIFENKVDSWLHGDQFKNYCRIVADLIKKESKELDELTSGDTIKIPEDYNYGGIHFILFKTGRIFEDEKIDFEEKKKELYKEFNSKENNEQSLYASYRSLDGIFNHKRTWDTLSRKVV